MNTYVTFEQAKKLKEKGFDVNVESCDYAHSENENWVYKVHPEFPGWKGRIREAYFENKEPLLRPEHWQVIEWLRINHGIWITVANVYSEYTHWAFTIGKNGKGQIVPFRQDQDKSDYFKIPQEAYSAAFDTF